MQYFWGFICVVALGVMGCSETAGTGGSGGSAGDGGSAGSGATATVSFFVLAVRPEGGVEPLEGVLACETDTTNCVMTDDGGNAALDLPLNREISYTLEKEGYGSQLRADVIPADGSFVPTTLPTDARYVSQFQLVMSPYPMEGTGAIVAQAFQDELGVLPIVGATFELLGTTGKAYYVDRDGNWSLDLTATTSDGAGGFVEVSPGEYEIEIGRTVENCQVLRGWPSDSENTFRVPVREGYFTISRWLCDELASFE